MELVLKENEKIKDIKGYEGLYAITTFGRVWSYKGQRFLKPGNNGHGYLTVALFNNGKKSSKRVHVLVAQTYIERPEGTEGIKLDVAHKDDNRQNNVVSNLSWMTRKENLNTEHFREAVRKRKYSVAVRCVETGEVFASQAEAARALGIHRYGISNVITGKQKTAGGYHWETLTN